VRYKRRRRSILRAFYLVALVLVRLRRLEDILENCRKNGIEVETLDEGSAIPHADFVEDVREMILDSVLRDV
jgi:hypothetical protein